MEFDESKNWDYGDVRLRVCRYIYFGKSNLQAIVLRGQLQLEFAVTRLLQAKVGASQTSIDRMSFARKTQLAADKGLLSEPLKVLLLAINKLRNVYVHDLTAHCTYGYVRSVGSCSRSRHQHRFHPDADEVALTEKVKAMGDLAERLFSPEGDLVDLLAELFCHVVFSNHDSFDIAALQRMPK